MLPITSPAIDPVQPLLIPPATQPAPPDFQRMRLLLGNGDLRALPFASMCQRVCGCIGAKGCQGLQGGAAERREGAAGTPAVLLAQESIQGAQLALKHLCTSSRLSEAGPRGVQGTLAMVQQ